MKLKKCDGCNVKGNWEHRCHGGNCECENLVCIEKQDKITHEEMMKIINTDSEKT